MTKAEQDRLLSEKPKVVPDELEPEATPPNASEKDEEKSSSPEPEQINLSGENFRTDAEEPEKETMSMDAPEEVGGLRCFLGSTLREASDLSAPGIWMNMCIVLRIASSHILPLRLSYEINTSNISV
ncbi:hypothetical protein DM860_001207 [Cuscuta australis]|uniref:Uncharacterized protein n=1 Tax=Cuscuta australis TaxID=267555 RepID=A0A328DT27_9ASTE|nr:hypothetical protein DM860_001207 [Cuscuta australis]